MRRPNRLTLGLGATLAVLLAAVIWAFAFPSGELPHVHHSPNVGAPAPPCPYGYVDRVGQEARIRAALESEPEGQALLEELGETSLRFCFADEGPGYVTDGRVILLSERMEGGELVARAAHLISHVTRGMPLPERIPGDADCAALLERAVEREADAYVLEVELRDSFEVEGARYEFEAAVRRAEGPRRAEIVRDYLREHPEGGPNLEALVGGYGRRCARATGADGGVAPEQAAADPASAEVGAASEGEAALEGQAALEGEAALEDEAALEGEAEPEGDASEDVVERD